MGQEASATVSDRSYAVTATLATKGTPTTADLIAGALMGVFSLVLLVLLIIFLLRWQRVKNADNKWQAIQFAFGEAGARRLAIGWAVFVVASIALALTVKATGG